jgi:hypothetical protein
MFDLQPMRRCDVHGGGDVALTQNFSVGENLATEVRFEPIEMLAMQVRSSCYCDIRGGGGLVKAASIPLPARPRPITPNRSSVAMRAPFIRRSGSDCRPHKPMNVNAAWMLFAQTLKTRRPGVRPGLRVSAS